MGLVRAVYTKLDNGCCSEWEEWAGEITNKRLVAVGWAYAKMHRVRGKWMLSYVPLDDGLTAPPIFGRLLEEDELPRAVEIFIDWAMKNQIDIIAAAERDFF